MISSQSCKLNQIIVIKNSKSCPASIVPGKNNNEAYTMNKTEIDYMKWTEQNRTNRLHEIEWTELGLLYLILYVKKKNNWCGNYRVITCTGGRSDSCIMLQNCNKR